MLYLCYERPQVSPILPPNNNNNHHHLQQQEQQHQHSTNNTPPTTSNKDNNKLPFHIKSPSYPSIVATDDYRRTPSMCISVFNWTFPYINYILRLSKCSLTQHQQQFWKKVDKRQIFYFFFLPKTNFICLEPYYQPSGSPFISLYFSVTITTYI